jgi:hypothetical protein
MNRSRSSLRNNAAVLALFLLAAMPLGPAWSIQSAGGTNVITKDLVSSGGGGSGVQGSGFTLDFSIGEPAAGFHMSSSSWSLASGYLAARLGAGQTLRVVGTQVGGAPYFYDRGLRLGATSQAVVQIDFSDQLDPASFAGGISVNVLQDHLGQSMNVTAPVNFNYDPTSSRLRLLPDPSWTGNTLYDVVLNVNLISQDGFSLETSTHLPFMTALDPRQENIVSSQFNGNVAPVNSANSLAAGVNYSLHLPQGSLSDFATILFSPDPVNSPLHADPAAIQDANRKAQSAGGSYQSPVTVGEIAAFNVHGEPIQRLSLPAQVSISFSQTNGLVAGPAAPVRAGTLSLWALDASHHLWVKLPDSSVNGANQTVTGDITAFSAFSLIGAPSGNAQDVFVFPNPWRPHGPTAGTGSNQTGTEAGGMTFNNLPSECTISIYTLSQERVRKLSHSDLGGTIGQEKWDGLTSDGSRAASGVYIWRVESSADGKTGKLLIIR